MAVNKSVSLVICWMFLSFRKGEAISTACRLPGELYQGNKNITETGRQCQRWDMQSPHKHSYDAFSLAQENYCRNFDIEEPWCFTNDSDVRWQLCGVDVCVTPCLNQSFYTEEITAQCVSHMPSDSDDCRYVLNIVSCLKKNVENITGSQCGQITWRSVALQIQDTVEKLTGKSISKCLLSPCRDPSLISISNQFVVVNFAMPCYNEFFSNAKGDSLCRAKQRIGHCVISKIHDNDKTNSTCLVKDKVIMADKFQSLLPTEIKENATICVKDLFSEFPATMESIIGTSTLAVSPEVNSDLPQTSIFFSVGFALVFICVVSFAISIYKIRTITVRKRRKELMRLPSIPKLEDHPYEVNPTYLDGPHLDPDYETVDEQDEGYEHLTGPGQNPSAVGVTDEDGSYTVPNNKDGSYLDVVPSNEEPNDYINVSPYLDLENDAVDIHLKSESMDIFLSNTSETITVADNIGHITQ